MTPDTPTHRKANEGDAGRAASVYARECAKLRGELAALREAVALGAKHNVTIGVEDDGVTCVQDGMWLWQSADGETTEHPADALVRWHQETNPNV